ncbi:MULTISPECIES: hypothetical protein [unclassified Streptomyces]|uniref:hypothetical protein n=1 Tax=unclassified Streptomyces TaxID=2593676 RepID=UPI00382A94E9
MAEQFMTFHCTPCPSCRGESWQRIVDGRLRWEWQHSCPADGSQACDGGRGPGSDRVRAQILAEEGAVHLAVGGPDGLPLQAVRALYGLTLAELNRAREHGIDATPVEAQYLAEAVRRAAGPAGPG